MRKTLLHSNAQICKITIFYYLLQLFSNFFSYAHITHAGKGLILQKAAAGEHTAAAHGQKRKKIVATYICLQRLLVSSRHKLNREYKILYYDKET